jgi:translation initiation factor eIF-2B subunit alpha
MCESLNKIGVSCTLILDAAIGPIMEKIDFVLLGAEGVVESGGIINKIGSSTICLCAKSFNKPVYVAVESFKFVRFYPLNNRDIPDEFKVTNSIHYIE